MFLLGSSSPLSLLLLFLVSVSRPSWASDCSDRFRSGEDNFVIDAEDSVKQGAQLLSTQSVSVDVACEQLCCQNTRCNLALLEPRASELQARTCVLFDCVHKNRFVCQFVNQAGYQSFIRLIEFHTYLKGPGKKAPPIANAGRDVVVQPGEEVTLNGIESQALHGSHIVSYSWTLESGGPAVQIKNTDLPDQVKVSNLQKGLFIFQLKVTDTDGQSADDRVRVLVLSPEQSGLYCQAPAKVGPCRAAFTRWRYNAKTGGCETFVFGGCSPNENNFLSEDECVSACRGVTESSERSLPHPKVCKVACSPDQLTCDGDCCLDRGLECDGVFQCDDHSDENKCNELNETFSGLLMIKVTKSEVRCTEPRRTGPCRASFPRWYYDPVDRKCYGFTYGGCDANGNNFEEEAECMEMCRGVTEKNLFSRGMFGRSRADEQDGGDSGSIALAVLLSVAILALLAVLGYCFLRSRKNRNRGAAASSPGRVELSEQDTLVYNSTTKPL